MSSPWCNIFVRPEAFPKIRRPQKAFPKGARPHHSFRNGVTLGTDCSLADVSAAFDRLSADINVVLAQVCCGEPLDSHAFSFVSLPHKLRLLVGYLQLSKRKGYLSVGVFDLIERIDLQYRIHEREKNEFVKRRGQSVPNEYGEPALSASDIDRLCAELSALLGSFGIDARPALKVD